MKTYLSYVMKTYLSYVMKTYLSYAMKTYLSYAMETFLAFSNEWIWLGVGYFNKPRPEVYYFDGDTAEPQTPNAQFCSAHVDKRWCRAGVNLSDSLYVYDFIQTWAPALFSIFV